MRIAVLGGTGPEGLGLATRLVAVGETVIIGSRSEERAAEAANGLRAKLPQAAVSGAANVRAAEEAEIVIIAVPFEGLDLIIDGCGAAMTGKVVIDTVVPLRVEKGFFSTVSVAEGSAGERLQARVPAARVVSAFKHQSAHELAAVEHAVEGDVLLCGNDGAAKTAVAGLVKRIRDLRPVDAGDLRVAAVLESMTGLLLNLNRRHKTRASVRILGL